MEIQTQLLNLLSEAVAKTKEYIDIFEAKDSYLFSKKTQKKAKIKESFITLSSYLVSISEKTDSLTANISALVCNSDENMDNDNTLYFSNILENYFLWRKTLLSFLDNTTMMLKGDEIKYSLLISHTQTFLNASENLIGILKVKQ